MLPGHTAKRDSFEEWTEALDTNFSALNRRGLEGVADSVQPDLRNVGKGAISLVGQGEVFDLLPKFGQTTTRQGAVRCLEAARNCLPPLLSNA